MYSHCTGPRPLYTWHCTVLIILISLQCHVLYKCQCPDAMYHYGYYRYNRPVHVQCPVAALHDIVPWHYMTTYCTDMRREAGQRHYMPSGQAGDGRGCCLEAPAATTVPPTRPHQVAPKAMNISEVNNHLPRSHPLQAIPGIVC